MREIRVYMPEYLIDKIDQRCEELEINRSEYLRTLANLDMGIQNYQQLVSYTNKMFNTINNFHEQLGIYVTPLQKIPTFPVE